MTGCGYDSAGWFCTQGALGPPFGGPSPFEQPCPACNTLQFLEVAIRRAGIWRRKGLCPFCAPGRSDPATAALDAALKAAFDANPAQADRAATELGIERKHFSGRGFFCAPVEDGFDP